MTLFYKLLKLQHRFYLCEIYFMAKFIRRLIRILYSCDIPYQIKIPEGLRMPHSGLGVIIHEKAKFGKNCTIAAHVIIGGNNGAKHAPIIGNDCKIHVGSKIIGETIIGDNCVIGAGAVVVNKIIPANTIVIGPKLQEFDCSTDN